MTFGERLKELRESQGISQSELARRIGVSRSTICNYENGRREKPSTPVVYTIAEALNATPKDLYAEIQLIPHRIDPDSSADREYVENSLLFDAEFSALKNAYIHLNESGAKLLVEFAEALTHLERYQFDKYVKPDGSIGTIT